MGYYGRKDFSSSLEAELWSIFKGLEIVLERKLKNVKIESDFLTAVNLINEGNPTFHPQCVVINDTHQLMARTDTPVGHIYCSANDCADYLARWGAEQEEDMVFVMEMPIDMREFVIMDGLNIRQVLD